MCVVVFQSLVRKTVFQMELPREQADQGLMHQFCIRKARSVNSVNRACFRASDRASEVEAILP